MACELGKALTLPIDVYIEVSLINSILAHGYEAI